MRRTKVQRPRKNHHIFRNTVIVFFVLILLAIIGMVALFSYYYPKVPPLNTQLFDYSQNAVIYDRNDQPYQNLQGEENRQTLVIDQIPEQVRNAFIAIEDKRFYQHHGVDIKGILRAAREVVSNQNLNGSGGSTITQQLIKLTHLSASKTLERKFDEWVLAIELEQVYSKNQILAAYLNKVNFHGSEGIQAAAWQYFGKNVAELTLGQTAILAAVPNSPIYFDPYTYNPDTNEIIVDANNNIVLNPNNQTRALNVINEMQDQGYITPEEADAARNEIKTAPGLVNNNPNRIYSYFTDAVYMSLLDDVQLALNMSEEEAVKYINTTGLKIYSTVDPNIQKILEDASHNDELFPEQSENAAIVSELTGVSYIPEVGATIIDNEDGSIIAMIGGREEKTSLSLNRATSSFQTGSSTKPLTTYGPALEEEEITLAKQYNDHEIDIDGWKPQNSDGEYIGNTTVRNALAKSINTIAVQVNQDLGITKSADYAKQLGLTIVPEDMNSAALALGGYSLGQTTEQMASAFSTFARQGKYIQPYLYREVLDDKGNIIISNEPEEKDVFSPDTAFLITDVLKQACQGGTTTININNMEVAGKTGTTDNEVNAWFCGYCPTFTMAVWYGYDQNNVEVDGTDYPLYIGIAGGSKPGPASLFENVFATIEPAVMVKTFSKPETIIQYPSSGTIGNGSEYYKKGTAPAQSQSQSSQPSGNDSRSSSGSNRGISNSNNVNRNGTNDNQSTDNGQSGTRSSGASGSGSTSSSNSNSSSSSSDRSDSNSSDDSDRATTGNDYNHNNSSRSTGSDLTDDSSPSNSNSRSQN